LPAGAYADSQTEDCWLLEKFLMPKNITAVMSFHIYSTY
jgi:hypothetical protein